MLFRTYNLYATDRKWQAEIVLYVCDIFPDFFFPDVVAYILIVDFRFLIEPSFVECSIQLI